MDAPKVLCSSGAKSPALKLTNDATTRLFLSCRDAEYTKDGKCNIRANSLAGILGYPYQAFGSAPNRAGSFLENQSPITNYANARQVELPTAKTLARARYRAAAAGKSRWRFVLFQCLVLVGTQ